ncbi:MAG TPA: TIM barrel protein [Phycisphaerae bacterium]|nr:TIM barrel protein [Phycisphaerae bacterium]
MVRMSISIASVQQAASFEASAARAAEAGFDAVELAILDDGPLSYGTPEAECRRLADGVRQSGLAVSALAAGGTPASKLISSFFSARRDASQHLVAALDRARWLGARTVVLPLPPTPSGISGETQSAYEKIYGLALDVLLALRFEAEQRAIGIACGHDRKSFLASPLELRRFIDEINSPWVGVDLHVTDALPGGTPQDWIALLGHRLIGLYVDDSGRTHPSGEANPAAGPGVDCAAVAGTLQRIRYAALLTYRGSAEPQQARLLLESLKPAARVPPSGESGKLT